MAGLFAGLSASASPSGLGFLTAWQVSSYGEYPWREQGKKGKGVRDWKPHTEELYPPYDLALEGIQVPSVILQRLGQSQDSLQL